MLGICDLFAEVSLAVAQEAWERWFSERRFARKLEQLQAAGLLEVPRRAGNVDRVIRLTEQGRLAALGGRDPEACWRRPWDGRWRLALFDVPESKRALRMQFWRRLRELGFGYLQQSVWISPDSVGAVKELLSGSTLDVETLTFMEARPCTGETDAEIVQGAWDFERINRNYTAYLEVLRCQPSRRPAGAWRAWFDVEWKAWRHALRSDPLLPESLLPAGYAGVEAWRRRQANLRSLFGRK